VDTFVFLDTVQFDKRSWQQRNRIKTPAGLQWLTVPVISRGKYEQKIQDVEILDTSFIQTHLRTVKLNYSPAPYFPVFFSKLESILSSVTTGMRLLELNVRLVQAFVEFLQIRTPLLLASSLNEPGKRTELLTNICRRLGANEYVSPIGSAEYLLEDLPIMSAAHVEICFHNYIHPEYEQRFPPFLPYASVVDLIFNEGHGAMEIIRSGRRDSLTARQAAANLAEMKKV
jgi:hypothetical protein